MAGMPPISASAGGGGPSGSSSNAGIQDLFSNPFNFDHSGWIVNVGSAGASNNATGSKDANGTSQTPTAGGLGGLLGGIDPMILAVGLAALLLLRR